MHAGQRNLLLLGLAAISGSLDAWSYFGLGQVFIANMTGNTVLLGFHAVHGEHWRALAAGAALAAYSLGVFAGSLLSKPIRAQVRLAPVAVLWPRRTTLNLALELLLLLLASALALFFHPQRATEGAYGLICLGASAIGIQSATITSMSLPGIVTTYISGTWTTLASGLAQLLGGEKQGKERSSWEKQLLLQAMVLLAYCGSAAAAALVMQLIGRAAISGLPIALLLLVLAGSLAWGDRQPS